MEILETQQHIQTALDALEGCKPAIESWRDALEGDGLANARQHLDVATAAAEESQASTTEDQRALDEEWNDGYESDLNTALTALAKIATMGANTSVNDHLACANTAAQSLEATGGAVINTTPVTDSEAKLQIVYKGEDDKRQVLIDLGQTVYTAATSSVNTIGSKLGVATQAVEKLQSSDPNAQNVAAHIREAKRSLTGAAKHTTATHSSCTTTSDKRFTIVGSGLNEELTENATSRHGFSEVASQEKAAAAKDIADLQTYLRQKLNDPAEAQAATQATNSTAAELAQAATQHVLLLDQTMSGAVRGSARRINYGLKEVKEHLGRRLTTLDEIDTLCASSHP